MTQLEAVTKTLIHGQTTVGTSAVQLTTNAEVLVKGVLIKAAAANSASIFVGKAGVAATGATNGGLALAAGEGIFIPVEDASTIWLISTTGSQGVSFLGI